MKSNTKTAPPPLRISTRSHNGICWNDDGFDLSGNAGLEIEFELRDGSKITKTRADGVRAPKVTIGDLKANQYFEYIVEPNVKLAIAATVVYEDAGRRLIGGKSVLDPLEDMADYFKRVAGMGTNDMAKALKAKPRALQIQWHTNRRVLKERVAGYLALRALDNCS